MYLSLNDHYIHNVSSSSREELQQRLIDSQLRINSLSEEIGKLTSTSGRAEAQQEKLTQVNNKLKRALQSLKDKIYRVVLDRPDLFANVGDETSERLDHLISTVEHQAAQIDDTRAERERVEKERNAQIRDLQR